MDVRAAVAHQAGAPLTIETVQLSGPRAGEVLVESVNRVKRHTKANPQANQPGGIKVAFLSSGTPVSHRFCAASLVLVR